MKVAAIIFGLILTAFSPCGRAQEGERPQPPPSVRPDKQNRDHARGSHQGFGVPGGAGMLSHGDRERFDMFKDMPEDQKQKVRAAFEKAWKKPEVTEARERLMQANEDYRKSIHDALVEADPEVAKILDNRKPPMGPGGPGVPGKMPDFNDPEFASKALQHLKMESQPGDRRDSPMSRMHEKVMQTSGVAEAVKNLQQTEPAKRMEAWTRLREVYQASIKAEFGKIRENFKKDGPSPRVQKNGTEPSDESQKP